MPFSTKNKIAFGIKYWTFCIAGFGMAFAPAVYQLYHLALIRIQEGKIKFIRNAVLFFLLGTPADRNH